MVTASPAATHVVPGRAAGAGRRRAPPAQHHREHGACGEPQGQLPQRRRDGPAHLAVGGLQRLDRDPALVEERGDVLADADRGIDTRRREQAAEGQVDVAEGRRAVDGRGERGGGGQPHLGGVVGRRHRGGEEAGRPDPADVRRRGQGEEAGRPADPHPLRGAPTGALRWGGLLRHGAPIVGGRGCAGPGRGPPAARLRPLG